MTNDTATSSRSNRPADTDLGTGSVIHGNGLDRDFRRRSVRQMGHEPTSTIADASQRPRLNRSRWAAIGAAVAVSLGAGGFGLASATVSTGEQPVYIAISPCRLADTRPQFLVGNRATPINGPETVTYVGTGAQGNCNVPAGVSALVLNVTALDATLPTFLQFAPGNSVPVSPASSLNPVPGEPPTPNAVTIPIDDEGEFSMYNLRGTVNVIIDIVGYYDDHEHTGADIVDGTLTGADVEDETLTGADVESITGADIDNSSLGSDDISDEARVVSVVDERNCVGLLCFFSQSFGAGIDILGGTLFAPRNGFVTVDATIETAMIGDGGASGNSFTCKLVNSTTGDESANYQTTSMVPGATAVKEVVSLTHTFSVGSGANAVHVRCATVNGNAGWYHGQLTATYVSTTGGLILFPIIAEPASAEAGVEVTEAVTESSEPVTAATVPADG